MLQMFTFVAFFLDLVLIKSMVGGGSLGYPVGAEDNGNNHPEEHRRTESKSGRPP